MSNGSMLKRWQSMPSKKRMWIAGGGGFALLVTAISMMTPSTPLPANNKGAQPKVTATKSWVAGHDWGGHFN